MSPVTIEPDEGTPTLAEEINNNTVAVQDTEPPPAIAQDPTPVEPVAVTSDLGDLVDTLLTDYLPCQEGDEKFAEIAKDWTGGGTTCGFLVHWLLFRLGYRNAHVVNRNEPEAGLKYVDGANISRVWCGGHPPFQRFKMGTLPEKGDILFLSNGPPNTEHVEVFMDAEQREDGLYWRMAAGGQTGKNGKQAMHTVTRKQVGRTLVGSSGVSKGIQGWIPIRSLGLG